MIDSNIESYDQRIDVWYIGVIALFLFSNNVEAIQNENKEYWLISSKPQSTAEQRQKHLQYVSLEAIRFINSLLRADFHKRP